jgi:hypothetical protein
VPVKTVDTSTSTTINNSTLGDNPVYVVSNGDVRSYSPRTVMAGDNSFIGAHSKSSMLLGDDSIIEGGSYRSMIIGSGSTVAAGTPRAFVFGDNISATTSDTLYVGNIQLSSGGTINGIPLSGLTGSTGTTGAETAFSGNSSGNIKTIAGTTTVVNESSQDSIALYFSRITSAVTGGFAFASPVFNKSYIGNYSSETNSINTASCNGMMRSIYQNTNKQFQYQNSAINNAMNELGRYTSAQMHPTRYIQHLKEV